MTTVNENMDCTHPIEDTFTWLCPWEPPAYLTSCLICGAAWRTTEDQIITALQDARNRISELKEQLNRLRGGIIAMSGHINEPLKGHSHSLGKLINECADGLGLIKEGA